MPNEVSDTQEVRTPLREWEVVLQENQLLFDAQGLQTIDALYKEHTSSRDDRKLDSEEGPFFEIRTPSGWVLQKIGVNKSGKDYTLKKLFEGQYIEYKAATAIVYRWKFDHSRVTRIGDKSDKTAYSEIRAEVNVDGDITCSFLQKKIDEESVRSAGSRFFKKADWDAHRSASSPVGDALRSLYNEHLSS